MESKRKVINCNIKDIKYNNNLIYIVLIAFWKYKYFYFNIYIFNAILKILIIPYIFLMQLLKFFNVKSFIYILIHELFYYHNIFDLLTILSIINY